MAEPYEKAELEKPLFTSGGDFVLEAVEAEGMEAETDDFGSISAP